MPGLRDLAGRVALVTGASSGIGEALARELAHRGAHVALLARRKERLDSIVSDLAKGGHRAAAFRCDVRDADAIAATAREIEGQLGPVALLVNNAGSARHILFRDHPADEIQDLMLTNYMGTVHWIKCILPSMRERGSGWILNLGSFAGKIGQADEVAYSASKFAVAGLSQGLAQELAPEGIHVLCVSWS